MKSGSRSSSLGALVPRCPEHVQSTASHNSGLELEARHRAQRDFIRASLGGTCSYDHLWANSVTTEALRMKEIETEKRIAKRWRLNHERCQEQLSEARER